MIGQSHIVSLVVIVVVVLLSEVSARLGGKRAMIDASSLASVEDVRHAAEDVLKRFHQEEVRHQNSLSLSLSKTKDSNNKKTVGSRFRRRFAGERCR